jgi:hypothetical protein
MTQDWQIDGSKVLDIGGEFETVKKLSLGLVGGRVDIVSHDDSPTARLEVHEVDGPPLLVTWDGATLKVSHVKDKNGDLWESLKSFGQDKGRRSARVSVSVPAGTEVSASTVSADTLVNGIRAKVKANTVTGAITLDDITGDVEAGSVSGDIECHGLGGDCRPATWTRSASTRSARTSRST